MKYVEMLRWARSLRRHVDSDGPYAVICEAAVLLDSKCEGPNLQNLALVLSDKIDTGGSHVGQFTVLHCNSVLYVIILVEIVYGE